MGRAHKCSMLMDSIRGPLVVAGAGLRAELAGAMEPNHAIGLTKCTKRAPDSEPRGQSAKSARGSNSKALTPF